MGLLDDAIREHLELKRLKGADPQEIARDERDALSPGSAAVANGDELAENPPLAEPDATDTAVSPQPVHGRGQETVELDMGAVLEDEHEQEERPPLDPQDSLEWEMPGETSGDVGREDGGPDAADADEQVDDVLEETPDFLRETPEQERLWFEQRPPRDFDFNE